MKKSPPLRHLKQRCRNNFSHHHGSDDIRAGVIGECLIAVEWYYPLVDSMRESIFSSIRLSVIMLSSPTRLHRLTSPRSQNKVIRISAVCMVVSGIKEYSDPLGIWR